MHVNHVAMLTWGAVCGWAWDAARNVATALRALDGGVRPLAADTDTGGTGGDPDVECAGSTRPAGRASSPARDRAVYAGTIVSPTPVHVTPVDLEPNDPLNLSPDGRTISFAFNNYGRTDGADFFTDCADYLTVGPLTADNAPLSTGRIYLGANEIHPESNPLTIHRHEP